MHADIIEDANRIATAIESGELTPDDLQSAAILLRALVNRSAIERVQAMKRTLTYWKAGRNAAATAMMEEDPDGGTLFAEAHEARDHIMSLDPLKVPEPVTVDGDLAAMRELVSEMFTFARTADGRELIDRGDVVEMLDMAIYSAPSEPGF